MVYKKSKNIIGITVIGNDIENSRRRLVVCRSG